MSFQLFDAARDETGGGEHSFDPVVPIMVVAEHVESEFFYRIVVTEVFWIGRRVPRVECFGYRLKFARFRHRFGLWMVSVLRRQKCYQG